MRRFCVASLLVVLSVAGTNAQTALTEQQRIADLNQLASFYSKNYAPYEWKRDVLGFDLLRLNQWMKDLHKTTDLDFQEVLIEYVASLNDAHDYIAFPTTFSASLGLSVDIYDGKVLIDAINRNALPVAQFPFVVGDELVLVDGVPVQDIIKSFRKYAISANQRSTDRIAASRLVSRSQQIMPHIVDLGPTAALGIRLASTGALNTYIVPWTKIGIPVTSQGPVPSPGRQPFRQTEETLGTASQPGSGSTPLLFHVNDVALSDDTLPSYMQPIQSLLNASVPQDYYSVHFGSKFPIYGPPPGFVQRLGGLSSDFILTGTFVANGLRIGFIRIPSMSPPSTTLAL